MCANFIISNSSIAGGSDGSCNARQGTRPRHCSVSSTCARHLPTTAACWCSRRPPTCRPLLLLLSPMDLHILNKASCTCPDSFISLQKL
jgi:hypothetical protein